MNLQPGDVHTGIRRSQVVFHAADAAAVWDSTVTGMVIRHGAVVHLGRVGAICRAGWRGVRLHLDDRAHPVRRHADGHAGDPGLDQQGVEQRSVPYFSASRR